MKDFFHSIKFKLILCLFALVLGFMIYAAVSGGNIIFPKSILETITQPIVSTATAISGWAERTLDAFLNAEKYRDENEMLQEKLTEIYLQIIDKDKTDEENEQLREMLEIAKENDDYEWSAPCSVIARNANDVFGSFTIDKGSSDGIELHDPVFTKIGLVGYITEISPHYAVVTTILSPEISIGVITADKKVVGIVENDILYSADGRCLMSYISKVSEIADGDIVITSGGAVFPAGIMVGTVETVYSDANGLTLHAVIKPAENVINVTNVFVVTDFEGQGIG